MPSRPRLSAGRRAPQNIRQRLEYSFKLVECLGIECIQDLWPVQCYCRHLISNLAQQRLVAHSILRRLIATPDDTIELMVKGITLVSPIASGDTFDKLNSLFLALGFESGKGWKDEKGRGIALVAPLGNLEFVTGRPPAVPPVLIEVTNLDTVHAAVQSWMLGSYRTEDVALLLSSPALTHWNSRLFTVELAPELKLGFWQSENPLHGKPVAIEGDLSAGMRFAIVTARWNAVITDRLLQGSLDGSETR